MDAVQQELIDNMDPRLKLLSYSFQTLLHTCPRKYQLTRIRATQDEQDPYAALNQNLTFAFGHIVGSGIQDVMCNKPYQEVIFNMFLAFHADILDRNDKQVKSFWHAMLAIDRLISMREQGFLDEYELVFYNGQPAIELSFLIQLPDGFKMRGSVDAILRHKETGKILVLECKTSSATTLNGATYKNSSQALGYSVILDILFPSESGYDVLYLVYLTKQQTYEQLHFHKNHTQKALWIQELLLDVETLKLYETSGVYPMFGHSCYDFFKECEFFQTCNLSTKLLTTAQTQADNTETNSTYTGTYTITLSLLDLISGQLDKNEREELGRDSSIGDTDISNLLDYNPSEDVLL